jgi:hypothetical protein
MPASRTSMADASKSGRAWYSGHKEIFLRPLYDDWMKDSQAGKVSGDSRQTSGDAFTKAAEGLIARWGADVSAYRPKNDPPPAAIASAGAVSAHAPALMKAADDETTAVRADQAGEDAHPRPLPEGGPAVGDRGPTPGPTTVWLPRTLDDRSC